jgi:hypothetical protein
MPLFLLSCQIFLIDLNIFVVNLECQSHSLLCSLLSYLSLIIRTTLVMPSITITHSFV